MFKFIIIFSIFILAVVNLFAQSSEEYSAPVDWQRYAVSPSEVSISLPKMPVFIFGVDACNEKEIRHYYAYAEEVVYSLKIISRANVKAPQWCTTKKKFSQDSFIERIKEIKNASENINEEKFTLEGKEVTKAAFKTSSVWLFDDLINKRWFELSVSHRENAKIDTKAFVESIKFEKNPEGIKIGEGSERVLGDAKSLKENYSDPIVAGKSSINEENYPLTIVVKVKPFYTDAARQANVQGSVLLRVTFLGNGGIGAITPVSELPLGLTEQAIRAARQMAFLPQKKGNQSQTVVKSVQFNFSIY